MRSDAAPPLSQAITPTWSGAHIFTGTGGVASATSVVINGGGSSQILRANFNASANSRIWDTFVSSGGSLIGRALTDDLGTANNWVLVSRSGTAAITSIDFGNSTNNNTFNFNGTGTAAFGGNVTFTISGTGYSVGYRTIPRSTTATTLVAADLAKCVAVSANIAIPASVFAAGDAISIYNDSGSAVDITIAAGTLRLAGTTSTGTRALAARGIATLWFNVGGATPEVIASGNVT